MSALFWCSSRPTYHPSPPCSVPWKTYLSGWTPLASFLASERYHQDVGGWKPSDLRVLSPFPCSCGITWMDQSRPLLTLLQHPILLGSGTSPSEWGVAATPHLACPWLLPHRLFSLLPAHHILTSRPFSCFFQSIPPMSCWDSLIWWE